MELRALFGIRMMLRLRRSNFKLDFNNTMERIAKDHLYKEAAIQILQDESYCPSCSSLMLEPMKLECNHMFCVTCLKRKNEKLSRFENPVCPKKDCRKEQVNFDFKYSVDKGFQ